MGIAGTMRSVGYVLYAMAGVLRLITGGEAAPVPWIAAYVALGVAFHIGSSRPRVAPLAAMTGALLAMAYVRPCPYGALALVIVASQAALALRPVLAAAWAGALSAVIGVCLVRELGWLIGAAELVALVGFQAFAIALIASARREADTRAELGRALERARIARDLHDVLGHDLTALGLQLEIAAHVAPDAAPAHVANARAIAARLLADVRRVVANRPEGAPSLPAAIREFLVDAPGLAVHLDAPESLALAEPARTECVVRCVQELVTNARRHAVGAANLWLRLRREDGDLVVEARDDGKGASPVAGGSGLVGMRARLAELGGRLEVCAAPDAFVVTARLPIGGAP